MRLTKINIEKLLNGNEGYSKTTSYVSRNFKSFRKYVIKGGKLLINEITKSSWSDSRQEKNWIANEEETHRFLYNNQDDLNQSIDD